jgi:paraquat-inducible protein B
MTPDIPPPNNAGFTPELEQNADAFPHAQQRKRYLSGVWILPIIAALIAGYLGLRSYMEHGPDVTISFKSAEGLSTGQTQVKYKAVTLGTVKNIELKPDLSGVVVRITTTANARDLLTDHARFWIMRPQLNAANISDIQSLVSGTYIQVEPGAPGGNRKTQFTGMDQAPASRSDQPGQVYELNAARLGPITVGSPIYFRDIVVGQVSGYDIGDGFGPLKVTIFVRDPYAKLVRHDTRFWNVSGINVKVSGGIHIEFQSLQSIFAGGIAFDTPVSAEAEPQAEANASYTLFDTRQSAMLADGAGFNCVTYFRNPVKDLAPGSPVQIYGIYVGDVTDVKLVFDPQQDQSRIRVAFSINPNIAFGTVAGDADNVSRIMHDLVQKGMRANLQSSDIVLGHDVLSLQFTPKSEAADTAMEGDALVVPGTAGGSIAEAIGDMASKLNQIPFDQIGEHLNHLMASADQNFGGSEMKQAVHDLADTLANAKQVSQSASQNLAPAMKRLPEISNQLQSAVTRANDFMGSINAGYGEDSDFHRGVKRVMDEVNDAARSIRLLADYLDRHPEALLNGKSDPKSMEPVNNNKGNSTPPNLPSNIDAPVSTGSKP